MALVIGYCSYDTSAFFKASVVVVFSNSIIELSFTDTFKLSEEALKIRENINEFLKSNFYRIEVKNTVVIQFESDFELTVSDKDALKIAKECLVSLIKDNYHKFIEECKLKLQKQKQINECE